MVYTGNWHMPNERVANESHLAVATAFQPQLLEGTPFGKLP